MIKILIALLLGLFLGIFLKKKKKKLHFSWLLNSLIFLLVFFMGIEAGKLKINAFDVLKLSFLLAIFSILGSGLAATLLKSKN